MSITQNIYHDPITALEAKTWTTIWKPRHNDDTWINGDIDQTFKQVYTTALHAKEAFLQDIIYTISISPNAAVEWFKNAPISMGYTHPKLDIAQIYYPDALNDDATRIFYHESIHLFFKILFDNNRKPYKNQIEQNLYDSVIKDTLYNFAEEFGINFDYTSTQNTFAIGTYIERIHHALRTYAPKENSKYKIDPLHKLWATGPAALYFTRSPFDSDYNKKPIYSEYDEHAECIAFMLSDLTNLRQECPSIVSHNVIKLNYWEKFITFVFGQESSNEQECNSVVSPILNYWQDIITPYTAKYLSENDLSTHSRLLTGLEGKLQCYEHDTKGIYYLLEE